MILMKYHKIGSLDFALPSIKTRGRCQTNQIYPTIILAVKGLKLFIDFGNANPL